MSEIPEEQSMTTAKDVEKSSANTKKRVESKDAIRRLKSRLLPKFRYVLLFQIGVYLAMFIIGVLSVKKCPVNENIPLFLCITGFIGLASKLVTYLRDRIIPYFKIKHVESVLYTTEVIFFILGSYWVYKEYRPSYDPDDAPKYCQKTGYLFAFIYITTFYAIIGAILLISICLCCCVFCGIVSLATLVKDDIEDEGGLNEVDGPAVQLPYIDEETNTKDEAK